MTHIDSYNSRQSLIKKKFEQYQQDTKKPEHSAICDLFWLYDELMNWFYADGEKNKKELERWKDQIDLAGIKAHKIYTRLKERSINVAYSKQILKNREESCKAGPDKLDFHLHHNVIEDLLNFCIIGTTDIRELAKMRKNNESENLKRG